MPLIECPECKKQISSLADSCPHCGYSVEAAQAKNGGVTTIEKTSKQWKSAKLLGVALTIIGIIMAMNGSSVGTYAILLGPLLFVVAWIGAWWNNG